MNYGKKIALFRPSSRSIESESVLSFDDLEEDEKDTVKRKTRNLSEKKRRDQFNVLINELCSMVASNNKKLDKSSVLKSAIQFLRNHQEFSAQSAANEIKEDWKPTFLCNEEFTQLMLEAVDSFLVVFTQQGKVLFTSDSVTSLLGHLAGDLINHSLYDLMHEDDRLKVFDLLSKQPQASETSIISFTCHLRRGNIDPNDSVTYEYVRVYGTSQVVSDIDDETMMSDNADFIGIDLPEPSLCFCCTVQLLTSHIIREMSTVDKSTCEFTSRHSLEWKFLFLDHRAPPIIGYLPFEVLGTSGYDYYHPDDLEAVSRCHEQLMVMGKGTSSFYRFLTKGQQWIWLQTRYFITYHQWNSKPEFIVCTNTVVNYCDVRRQLRQEMGYQDGDSGNSVSATNSSNSSLGVPGSSKETASTQEGQVTSYGQSESLTLRKGSAVQSPDVASSQLADCDRAQLPHSTKQENSIRKHVSSQLQSLLQLHLQRSSSTSVLPSSSQPALISSVSGRTATVVTATATSVANPPRRASVSHTHLRTQISKASALPATGQTPGSSKPVPSIIPIMTALPTTWTPQATLTSPAQSSLVSQTVDITSPQPSPSITNQQPSYQQGLVLTAAQQLLHEQLMEKSEQLQDAIQKQQEELRLIKEQLAYAQSSNMPQQQAQPQAQASQVQHQKQHSHQYILQQRLGLPIHSMVLSPSAPRHQVAIMSSNPNEIFLPPITNVNMELSHSQHQQQDSLSPQIHQKQQQQQQQQQQVQLSHSHRQHQASLYQHQQIVLQQDAGLPGQPMVLAPNSPVHQLAMMAPNASQIFLSPITNISMDIQQQQQQQSLQQVQQQQLQQQHATQPLHYPQGVNCSSSDPISTTVDLSDSC